MLNEKKSPVWVGDDRTRHAVGDNGFLLLLENKGRGWKRIELRDHPACLDGTPTPRLYGSVGGGSTQVTALGIGQVVEVAKNGRGRVEEVKEPYALAEALSSLGYPELKDQL